MCSKNKSREFLAPFLDKDFKIKKIKSALRKLRKSSIPATFQLILTQNFSSNASIPFVF